VYACPLRTKLKIKQLFVDNTFLCISDLKSLAIGITKIIHLLVRLGFSFDRKVVVLTNVFV
jgi:hypothetical protein